MDVRKILWRMSYREVSFATNWPRILNLKMHSSVQNGLHLACFFFNFLFHLITVKTERMKLESRILKNIYLFQIVSNDPRTQPRSLELQSYYWTTTPAGSISSSWFLTDDGTAADRGRLLGLTLRGGWALAALLADMALGDLGFCGTKQIYPFKNNGSPAKAANRRRSLNNAERCQS